MRLSLFRRGPVAAPRPIIHEISNRSQNPPARSLGPALWIAALLLACSYAASIQASGFLRTRGLEIVDESGTPILLRGVGLGNWLLPEGYMWKFGERGDRPRKIEKLVSDLIGENQAARFWSEFRNNYIAEADIQKIAELGFNSVRPALNARLFLTEGEQPAPVAEGFALLDRLVRDCKKHGLYVIIDMHAAPGGQTGANIDDSRKDEPELFIDKRNQDRLVELWIDLARRYKDEPAVAAYDLLNEPLPERTGAEAKYKDQLEPLYRRITAAIRQVDKRHIITLEGADWANDWSMFTSPFDDNLVYQFHYYCWDRPDHLNDITRYLDHQAKLKTPVWVGETGEKDNAIYWATTQYFEAHRIGWSFWPWKKMATLNTPYSIKEPAGWGAVRAYSRGEGKPSPAEAQKAFDELLSNIKLENCVAFPDVVNALLRRVPGRVEAENYGHEGPGRAYSVKNASAKAKYYRTSEPVPTELVSGGDQGWRTAQAIHLTAGEWTGYTVASQASASYVGALRAKAGSAPASVQVEVNGHSQRLGVTNDTWVELPLAPASFSVGTNAVKVFVLTGAVSVDWLTFH